MSVAAAVMNTDYADIVKLAKGMIGPGDLNVGGALRPQASAKLISMVFEDDFLKHVTTRRMSRTTADVNVMDMAGRQMIAVPEGSEPTDAELAAVSEHGCTLRALPAPIFPSVLLSWLRDNADNPQMLQELEAGFAKKFRTEFVDLGFNGTNDTQVRGTWVTMNKGWVQVALDSAAGGTGVNLVLFPRAAGVLTGTWVDRLDSLLQAMPAQYRAEAQFIMSEADAFNYAKELAGGVTGEALYAKSPLRQYLGHQILTSKYAPAETVICTPGKNLIFGIGNNIRRDKAYHSRKRAIEYTFDMAADYEIAVKAACTIGQ